MINQTTSFILKRKWKTNRNIFHLFEVVTKYTNKSNVRDLKIEIYIMMLLLMIVF